MSQLLAVHKIGHASREEETFNDVLERRNNRYTELSLKHHIAASDFVLRFRPESDGHVFFSSRLTRDEPELEQALSPLNVDTNVFAAYFCSQLSRDERLLLSSADLPSSTNPSSENRGLPTKEQLQHVFDVLSTSVLVLRLDIPSVKKPDLIYSLRLFRFNSFRNYSSNRWTTKFTASMLSSKIGFEELVQCKYRQGYALWWI